LARAGEAEGLPPALALRLARSTVAGSGELAQVSAESPATLRENVTSPGGTTRAALDVLIASDGHRARGRRGSGPLARARKLIQGAAEKGARGEDGCRRPTPPER
jgi:pyrroline-5-carboxylate reductase